jgi:lipid II:glycine glycyltransferase (peptidoglycan interpeptide bridge formation enzyme)
MPTYAVQWAAMQWAKARGCTTYDLWGVPDFPEAALEKQFTERSDGLWGVYRFKRGFGGELRRTVGSADRVYNKMLYRLYRWRRGS